MKRPRTRGLLPCKRLSGRVPGDGCKFPVAEREAGSVPVGERRRLRLEALDALAVDELQCAARPGGRADAEIEPMLASCALVSTSSARQRSVSMDCR